MTSELSSTAAGRTMHRFRSVIKAILPAGVRSRLWRAFNTVETLYERASSLEVRAGLGIVGAAGFPSLIRASLRARGQSGRLTSVRLRGGRQIWLRSGTSDFDVFQQVILRAEYAAVDVPDAKFIVDAGGNIGLTSFYLLERYPNSKIVLIEPDDENFELAKRNLASFGSRCVLLNAAIWSGGGTVAVQRGKYRDGRHWATQVSAEVDASDQTVRSLTVRDVLDEQGWKVLDLLKMDVEGAEREIFAANTSFLSSTRCCVIELHGPECERAFESAIAPYPNKIRRDGELTIVEFSPIHASM